MTNYVDCRRRNSTDIFQYRGKHQYVEEQNCAKICIICRKSGCWSTNHPFLERINDLQKHIHIKAFVANTTKTFVGDSEPDDQDLIDDLVTHVLDIFGTRRNGDIFNVTQHDEVDHEALNILFKYPFQSCHCTLTHSKDSYTIPLS